MGNNIQKTQEEKEQGLREAIRAGLKDGSFFRAITGKKPYPDDVCQIRK